MSKTGGPDEQGFEDRAAEPLIDDNLIALVDSLPSPPTFAATLLKAVPQAQQIRTYLEEIAKCPALGESEQLRLLASIANDQSARKRLNEANLRLVVWVAKEYAGADLMLSDLITEGTIGLLKAIDTYDAANDIPFALHAAACIRHAVSQAVAYETSQNRVPAYLLEKVTSIKPVSQRLTEKTGREPTRQEVAKELGMSADELDRLVQLVKQAPEVEENSEE